MPAYNSNGGDSTFEGKRMIDHLLAMPQFVPAQPRMMLDLEQFGRMEHFLRGRLARAEVFEISNVSEYFWQGTDQEHWDVFEDFPCVMPPFENLWFEYRQPSGVASEDLGQQEWRGAFSRCGVLVSTVPVPPGKGISHISTCTFFFQSLKGHARGSICGPLVSISYGINGAGEPKSHKDHNTLMQVPAHVPEYAHLINNERYNHFHVALYPVLLALTFLNCRKTVVVQRNPESGLDRAHKQRHGRPLVTFKTLEVEPIKKLFKGVVRDGETLKCALHVCRGHFKDYREHGLFGRNKGLCWWGAQVRGTVERGAVVKDYGIGVQGDGSIGGISEKERA